MKHIILFLITFILIYLVYFIFVINRKKALNKWQNGKEISYLKKIYNVKVDRKKLKSMANVVALANAFIVATTITVVDFLNNFVSQMLIGFVVLIVLIVVVYHIIGKYYQKKNNKVTPKH